MGGDASFSGSGRSSRLEPGPTRPPKPWRRWKGDALQNSPNAPCIASLKHSGLRPGLVFVLDRKVDFRTIGEAQHDILIFRKRSGYALADLRTQGITIGEHADRSMYRNHRFAAESFFRSGVDRPDHSRVVDNAVRAEGGTSRTGVIIGFVQKSTFSNGLRIRAKSMC